MIAIIILFYLGGAWLAYYLARKAQKDNSWVRDWDDIKACLFMALCSWIGVCIAGWALLEDQDPPSWL